MLRNVVAVVGAGPAGCSTAIRLKKSLPELEVYLYEQRPTIGKSECGEAIGKKAVEENTDIIGKSNRYVARDVNDIIWKIGNKEKRIESEGYMIYRPVFNKFLTEVAEDAGVNINTGSFVTPERKLKEGWKIHIKTEDSEYDKECDVVVATDGASSATALRCNLMTLTQYKEWFRGHVLGYQMKINSSFSEDPLTFDFTPKPDSTTLYHYAFHQHNNISNFGFLTTRGTLSLDFLRERTADWIKKYGIEKYKIIKEMAQHIPVSGPIPKTYGDGIVVVGDAGIGANPIVGGGIHTALKGGELAAKTIVEAYEIGSVDEKVLKKYENRWKAQPFGYKVLLRGKRALELLRTGYKVNKKMMKDYNRALDITRNWGW